MTYENERSHLVQMAYNKIRDEYDDYIKDIKKLDKDEIVLKSYDIAVAQDIVWCFGNLLEASTYLSNDKLEKLLDVNHLLNRVMEEYKSVDDLYDGVIFSSAEFVLDKELEALNEEQSM